MGLEMPRGFTREDGYRYWSTYNRKYANGKTKQTQIWVAPDLYEAKLQRFKKRYAEWYRKQKKLGSLQYENAKAKNRGRLSQLRLDSPKSILLYAAKCRAKKQNVPFSLSIDDFEIPSICPVLGISLTQAAQKASGNSPSLDKLIPALGYVKDNVWVISMRANQIKNDATLEELKMVAKALAKKLKKK